MSEGLGEFDADGMEAAGRRPPQRERPFEPGFRARVARSAASLTPEQLAAAASIEGIGPLLVGNALGSSQSDLVYTPVTPCRIIDTRNTGSALVPGTSRHFLVAGTDYSGQGGSATGCGVPLGPTTAAVVNFVAVTPAGQGNLQVTPWGKTMPTASIVNYTPGVTIANGLTVAICDPTTSDCVYDITVRANVSSAHLVADVQGYLAAPVATPLATVQHSYSYTCPHAYDCYTYATCPGGYTVTGGGCQSQDYAADLFWVNSSTAGVPSPGNGWMCQVRNLSGGSQTISAEALCSRVPGR